MVLNQKTTVNRRRRRYRGRRKNGKSSVSRYAGYAKTGVGIASTAMRAFSLASKLASFVNTEVKRFPYGTFNPSIDYSASATFLIMNGMTQGVADNQRTGDSVKIMSCEVNGHITHNASSTAQIVRIIIFWDKQNTITNGASLLDNSGSSYVVDSPKVYDNRFEIRTLYDQRFVLSAQDPVAIIRIKLPVNLHTQYYAGTTTINSGALKLAMFSDQTINTPGCNMQAYVYYVDN